MDGAVGDLAVISGRKWMSFATGRGTARFAVVDRFACFSPNPRSRQEWTTRGRPCAIGTSVDLRATTRPDALVASHLRSSFRLCAPPLASPSPHRRLPRVVPPGFDAARQHAVDACDHLAPRNGFGTQGDADMVAVGPVEARTGHAHHSL